MVLCEVQGEDFAGFDGQRDLVGGFGGDGLTVGWGDGGDRLAFGGGYAVGMGTGRFEDSFGGFAVLPDEVDFEGASGAEAAEASGGPGCG